MDLGLAGKVVIVSGGGAGIGGAISIGLAAEGAIPAIISRSALGREFEAELKALAPAAMFVRANLESDEETEAAVAQVAASFGRIDGVVVFRVEGGHARV